MAVKPQVNDTRTVIGPQIGPQSALLASEADIAIFGGSAGSGKTYGLLLDPLRHYNNPHYGAVIFRRTSVQVKNEGALWDESMKLYPLFGAKPREHTLEWRFPSGMSISFAHLEYDKDVLGWQGSQLGGCYFDELTHFSEHTFFYMLSRLRSTSGAKPRVRATCNPDPDSFVRKLIGHWIGEDGLPIQERSGQLRWFIRMGDQMIWADSAEEIRAQYGNSPEIQPKSLTFIPAKLSDNKILMEKDPSYLGNLLALNRVDRARLLDGNWNIRASAGTLFKREWFPILDAIPGGWVQAVRFFDRASTKPHEGNKDPDWTRGLKMYKYADGTYCVVDLKSTRDTPGQVEQLIRNVAAHDGYAVRIMSQQDPGSAGVKEAEHFVRMLGGYDVHTETYSKDKITRAKPVSAQCEAGNIRVLRAPWNDEFFAELENFPEGAHDDCVDVLSGAYNSLCQGVSILDVL
jgi:predicted phage terminase large subunit-like protein